MRLLAQEIGHFLFGVQALTNIPVPVPLEATTGRFARAARYFPLIGVLVGLGAGVVYALASPLTGPIIAAGLAMVTAILLSGARAEDGLANFCEALRAIDDRARAYRIMEEGDFGSFAAIGIVLSIGLRWLAIASFAPFEGLIALILAHAISRAMLAPVLISGHFARSSELAAVVASGVRNGEALVALLLALAVAIIAGPAAGLLSVAAGAVCAGGMLAFIMRNFGGYTHHGLGAIQQVSEIGILIALSAALR